MSIGWSFVPSVFPHSLSLRASIWWLCGHSHIAYVCEESLSITVGLKGSDHANRSAAMKDDEQGGPREDSSFQEGADPNYELNLFEAVHMTANTGPNGM